MQQWEYRPFHKTQYDGIDEDQHMAALGKMGWECYAVIHEPEINRKVFYFKRPIPQPSTAEKIFNKVKNEVEGDKKMPWKPSATRD